MGRARDRASADLNGQEFILDADADTSITADTDDQVDIKVGGTDTLVVKSDVVEIKGSHPDLKLMDTDDNNYGGLFYNNGSITLATDHDATGATGIIKFAIDGNEDVRIDSGGDLTINDGNLVIGTGGHGIDFSAQTAASAASASATGELFDRYEEGIFTHAGNANMSINSVSARGFYTIIGDKCFINGFVRFTHSGSDNVTLSLPVASKGDITSPANGEQEASNITWFPSVNTSGDTQLVSMYVASGSSSVAFYNLGTGSGLVTNNGCDSTAEFYYNLNYKIA